MIKKVAILTLPFNGNYGGVLQASALYQFLAENEVNVYQINLGPQRNPSLGRRLLRFVFERMPLQNWRGHRRRFLFDRYAHELMPNRTRLISSIEEISEVVASERFDAIVVGSDQVWRWDYIASSYRVYFLDLPESMNAKRIAYGASFGSNEFPCGDAQDKISNLVSRFNRVSVRERSGVEICHELGRDNCEWVLDPTFLPSESFYNNIAMLSKDARPISLLVYSLDRPLISAVQDESKQGGLLSAFNTEFITLGSRHSVSDWISAFSRAKMIVTDSYHGAVFSILFRKQFVVLENSVRGNERFLSLLTDLGLMQRLLCSERFSVSEAKKLLNVPIDYEEVFRRIESRRTISIRFLLGSLDVDYIQ